MKVGVIAALCLVLGLSAGTTRADSFSDLQTSYARVGDNCGAGGIKTTFAEAEYTKALADAQKALKTAKSREAKAAIQRSIDNIKDCVKDGAITKKETPPRYLTCEQFWAYLKMVSFSLEMAKTQKTATDAEIQSSREAIRPSVEKCLRETMRKCIDPMDLGAVLNAVDVIETASRFTTIYSYEKETGVDRFLYETNPLLDKMTFCTNTDFACKGSPEACTNRVARIKAAFQTYIQ
jgi:hypothetical protein